MGQMVDKYGAAGVHTYTQRFRRTRGCSNESYLINSQDEYANTGPSQRSASSMLMPFRFA